MMFGLGALSTLRPGVSLREALRDEEAGAQRFTASVVFDDARLDIIETHTFDPRRGALKIAGFLAVELDEGGAIIHRFLFARNLAQQVGRADMDAAVSADMELVAAVDADNSKILDRRLGAVARTARDRDLELVRHPAAPAHPLDLDAEPRGILRSKAAPFGSHAGLNRPQRLAIGVTRDHSGSIEIRPDRR